MRAVSSSDPKKPVHVIAHTHWDRSWYWPFERFRVKLVECVKAVVRELKARPEYRFNFDGQVLMLEDFLQVCPEDRAFLQQCAREGRIKLGPMYCLSDVYCTGGEALIRNILIGKQWCEQFGGGYSRVLHMPDTFGITPSMPMIAAGFGMKAFTFMRGIAGQVPGLVDMQSLQGIEPQVPPNTRFFLWKAADGTTIPSIILRHGYASAAPSRFFDRATGEINFDRYVDRLKEAAAEWDLPPHEVVLLMAGVDHMIPWHRQAESMTQATAESAYDFRFSSLEAVADALAKDDHSKWPVCQNEFHGSGAASVLGGTVSSRIYLKQTNADIEQLLVNQVEPGAASTLLLGGSDPAIGLIPHAWKTLLVTHPHDDICGCSVDAVHRKNESDMAQAWESADAIRRRVFFQVMRQFGANRAGDDRPSFALVNFQAVTRTAPSRVQFDYEGQVEWGDIKLPDAYRIVDETGSAVPFRELSRGRSVQHPRMTTTLEIFAPLEPFAVHRFYIEEIASDAFGTQMSSSTVTAENAHLHVSLLPNGSFTLTDKNTGVTRSGLGLFSSQGDVGDSYDFSDIPDESEQVFDQLTCQLTRREWPGGLIELRAKGVLQLPASTDSVTRSRSTELVELPFTQTLLLAPGSRQVEVTIEFTNTAADHRLRWNLSLSGKAGNSLAGLKFNQIVRPAGQRPAGETAPRIFPEHPADHFVAADGVACFSTFSVNVEVVSAPESQRLAITICRSFSFLANPTQGATRPGTHAGPHTLTPEGRCLGRQFTQHFAVKLIPSGETGELFHQACLWRAQPLFGQIDATMPYPWRSRGTSSATDSLPLRVEGKVIISALKPAEDGNGVVLRLFNGTSVPQPVEVHHQAGSLVMPAMLDESEDSNATLSRAPATVSFTLQPFALRTLRITRI